MARIIPLLALLPTDIDRMRAYYANSFIKYQRGRNMVKVALFVRLQAKPGKEAAVASFLQSALPLANQEATTPVWFALQLGPSTFGIFDAFSDDAGRQAHLAGQIAAALMAKAPELLAEAPKIEKVDVLA